MKKVLLVSALVLVIATSMVSGTLAAYNLSIDDIVSGSVTAKNFTLIDEGNYTFTNGVTIAPGELAKVLTFTVSNFDSTTTAEVPMDLSIDIGLAASSGKIGAIAPLTVKVYTGTDISSTNFLGDMPIDVNGIGTYMITDELLINIVDANGKDSNTYTVLIAWPDAQDNTTDIQYAGNTHGSALTVSVTGTQK